MSKPENLTTPPMIPVNEWHFVEAGRYLERAENLLRLLQSLCHDYAREVLSSYPFMLSVLKSVSGYESHRKEHADTG